MQPWPDPEQRGFWLGEGMVSRWATGPLQPRLLLHWEKPRRGGIEVVGISQCAGSELHIPHLGPVQSQVEFLLALGVWIKGLVILSSKQSEGR